MFTFMVHKLVFNVIIKLTDIQETGTGGYSRVQTLVGFWVRGTRVCGGGAQLIFALGHLSTLALYEVLFRLVDPTFNHTEICIASVVYSIIV